VKRLSLAFGLALGAIAVTAQPALAATPTPVPLGQGTMHVRQPLDCSGTGEAAQVYLPFSLLFEGFEPHATGTVTAFTQPGDVEVGSATVTVDAQGVRFELVVGPAEPGQYKLVYDFGSGTGKQKVIRLIDNPATASPSPSETPSSSEAPSGSPSESTTETASGTPSESTSQSPGESTSPTGSAEPTGTQSATPTGSPTSSPPESGASATPTATTPGTAVEGEKLEFVPEADVVGDAAANLPKTGAEENVPWLAGASALLTLSGIVLVVRARRRPQPQHR
jgi:LPXTG-motif cell wall-anchored protein